VICIRLAPFHGAEPSGLILFVIPEFSPFCIPEHVCTWCILRRRAAPNFVFYAPTKSRKDVEKNLNSIFVLAEGGDVTVSFLPTSPLPMVSPHTHTDACGALS
ncbi:unnamed protein product, partial [Ectocarpus sp. 13 AM-2016]